MSQTCANESAIGLDFARTSRRSLYFDLSRICLSIALLGVQTAFAQILERAQTLNGVALYWPQDQLSYQVDSRGSAQVPLDHVLERARSSFSTWLDLECSGLSWREDPTALNRDIGYTEGSPNQNLILFQREQDEWLHDPAAIALTTLTYCQETSPFGEREQSGQPCEEGALLDADIELNEVEFFFTTSEQNSRYDLESVIAHEVGHFLGFTHNDDLESIMNSRLNFGELRRALNEIDRQSLCWIYPEEAIDERLMMDMDSTPLLSDLIDAEIDQDPRRSDDMSGAMGSPSRGCRSMVLTAERTRRPTSSLLRFSLILTVCLFLYSRRAKAIDPA
jgi:hypothetical protein